ncbi:hypothetical protein [Arachidicoccus terrestris]|uniref:hypothetical protein n=1 Tax=Arachidicoccus terrestris TaxID=2875539 RepID=UPI001CC77E60|nr:hypothetical protein [Arachidicoccus terrestris]UAY56114.1 hypothetical protein K9M52_03540 [Arachidicoccus terrestris]
MEDLEDFFWELYKEDLAREAKAEGFVEGYIESFDKEHPEGIKLQNIVESFISLNPEDCSAHDMAAFLGIEEALKRCLYPDRAKRHSCPGSGLLTTQAAQPDQKS